VEQAVLDESAAVLVRVVDKIRTRKQNLATAAAAKTGESMATPPRPP